jgi:3-dehydroquinate dehydratase II
MPSFRPVSRILVLHGPNLNLLGQREITIYGTQTLAQIDSELRARAQAAGVELHSVQSNHEGVLIDVIHAAGADQTSFILINPAGLTHTSVALRDALSAVAIPFIEIHLSNLARREDFRQHSYLSDLAVGSICGLGPQGYVLALSFILDQRVFAA